MTQRNRPITPRKKRIWTTSNLSLSISSSGAGGQVASTALRTDLFAKLGRDIAPCTLAHVWAKGAWRQSAAGDSSFEFLGFGITTIYPVGISVSTIPDLLSHDGDWQTHDVRAFREGITTQSPMIPGELAVIDIESSGQRRITRATDDVFVVARSLNTPSAGSFELQLSVTALWLID